MNANNPQIEQDRARLAAASQQGWLARFGLYTRLSGPGWIASAITLGGGSLASSLYLGVLGGYSLMWLQPFAMILGIIMLSAIGYVTLSTGQRPFSAINEHISPVLGWGWALAVAAANIIWCMPQFSLAHGVLSQNLMPGWLGADGSLSRWAAVNIASESDLQIWLGAHFHQLVPALVILLVCGIVTWSYDRGGWGLRVYETVLKLVVAMIVLSFFGVVLRLSFSSEPLNWGEILAGFVPNVNQFWTPAATFSPFLQAIESEPSRQFWTERIVSEQRDIMISAAATAVGINMTLMFPYSMLRKGWTKEFRGLSVFDLSTGMFIPYLLATGFVVIASAARFHTELPEGFEAQGEGAQLTLMVDEDGPKYGAFQKLLSSRTAALNSGALPEGEEELVELSEHEKHLAAMLVRRDAMDLSSALEPLTGGVIANVVFGVGVLAMVLSTISILMLISGFVFAEMMAFPPGGWGHKLGTLIAGVGGVLWPLFWAGQSKFYLAVVTSVFGFMLLPFAYVTFALMMNSRSLLQNELPRGLMRFLSNLLILLAAGSASVGAAYMIWIKVRWAGIVAVALFILLVVMVHINRRNQAANRRAD